MAIGLPDGGRRSGRRAPAMSSRGLEKMVRPWSGAGHPEHVPGTPRIRTSAAVARTHPGDDRLRRGALADDALARDDGRSVAARAGPFATITCGAWGAGRGRWARV